MKIRKRRTIEEVAEESLGDSWRSVVMHDIIQSIVGEHVSLTRPLDAWTAPMMITATNKIKQRVSHPDVSLLHKVMVYLTCSVMWRGTGSSPLTDPEYSALQRYVYAANAIDHISNFALGLHIQQVMLWGHKQLTDQYRKPGTMPLPELAKPKKKIKRLPKHKKQR